MIGLQHRQSQSLLSRFRLLHENHHPTKANVQRPPRESLQRVRKCRQPDRGGAGTRIRQHRRRWQVQDEEGLVQRPQGVLEGFAEDMALIVEIEGVCMGDQGEGSVRELVLGVEEDLEEGEAAGE